MSQLDQFIALVVGFDQKKFKLALGAFLGIIALSAGGVVYWFYTTRSTQIETLQQLHDQSIKVDSIVRDSDKARAEEDRIKALLAENKGFSIKSYFEQFCRTHNVTPEQGWDTESRSIEGNDTFDEIILPAQFRNQTTQGLVTLLASLNNYEIVYIKELDIKNEGKRTIDFDLTIATIKRKQFWED